MFSSIVLFKTQTFGGDQNSGLQSSASYSLEEGKDTCIGGQKVALEVLALELSLALLLRSLLNVHQLSDVSAFRYSCVLKIN